MYVELASRILGAIHSIFDLVYNILSAYFRNTCALGLFIVLLCLCFDILVCVFERENSIGDQNAFSSWNAPVTVCSPPVDSCV
jgi:hypothetical protein